ncbi:hypothetical protein DAPPUDRAFT_107298 [Daphnia pulex]|uniref:Uncharacterized protein n=1 Tax=Daphnia pulex TaxID=6669 RepID=E9GWN2_DAPPU|nr:hypothetical protein DAPPUDRAFT_107298 [Daphnia pulex]|eukprot:EFX76150.1 hypothetical protein DAPPUDRAFT_107298 [Daphnia pulex]
MTFRSLQMNTTGSSLEEECGSGDGDYWLKKAFLMLDNARIIYQRQAETNFKVLPKLSDTLFELSEVAVEKYHQAIRKLDEGTNSNADSDCTSNSGEAATSIQIRKKPDDTSNVAMDIMSRKKKSNQ